MISVWLGDLLGVGGHHQVGIGRTEAERLERGPYGLRLVHRRSTPRGRWYVWLYRLIACPTGVVDDGRTASACGRSTPPRGEL
ncbi:hypothetical protein [Streptomyces sp. NPDC046942]|uniref:hypothetical protein n=1 Tax=Streptomyces sp. NPDC046942 TaxID=3155137 RepID=UPI003409E519